MARKHERTAARRAAAQVLYSAAIREMSAADLLKDGLVDCLEHPLRLISGIEERGAEIDAIISRLAKNWTLERMPLMDVTIIRIALFEMLHVDEVPISVSINEAVELAKCFGCEDDSPKFVNGMLGSVARQMEAEVPDEVVCQEGDGQ